MIASATGRSAAAATDRAEALLRGATPRPKSGAATGTPGCDDCDGAGAVEGATPHPRSGAAAERSYPTSKEQRLHGGRRAESSYYTFKVRRGCSEEIP